MKISDLADTTTDALRNAGAYMADFVTPTVRLGVTGLSRAGKTVLITAIVRNLVAGGRLAFFSPDAEGRIVRAYLEPQPDDDVPRFAYEEHLSRLSAEVPQWPDGTRRTSQLRLTIEYQTAARLGRAIGAVSGGWLGLRRLHVDIVDYPGEWLADLALLDIGYRDWSRQAIAAMTAPGRSAASQPFLAFLAGVDGLAVRDEATAQTGARLFTDYLAATRRAEPAVGVLTPGRFLMPGDLAGSPLLTFFPLAAPDGTGRGSLGGAMERRYESYKRHVVKPFFRNHFARLDRQIVLVDVLAALNEGPAALAELARGMEAVLAAFRPGANSWLQGVFRRRVDRILFAATKADHLNHRSHDRLEALLSAMAAGAIERAAFAGAEVKVLALAALRATREAEAQSAGETLACIIGTPMAGEQVAGVAFDGRTETALFPGDLPEDPYALLEPRPVAAAGSAATAAPAARPAARPVPDAGDIRVLRFCPPRISMNANGSGPPAGPHIRLDRALEFLIGDRLA